MLELSQPSMVVVNSAAVHGVLGSPVPKAVNTRSSSLAGISIVIIITVPSFLW